MKPIFYLFFIAFLFSCGKERSIKIKAINAATGEPYAGLEYRVASSRTAANGEKYRTEASGTLNANGEVLVAIKQRSGRTYNVAVQGPENNCYTNMLVQTFDSPFDNDGTFTFEFAECAYLKLNINNINCQGPSDSMHFRSKQSYTDWQSFSGYRVGCYNYLSPDYFQVPAGWRIYNWVVDRNGVVTNFKDSIFLQPGTNGTITMNY